MPVPQRHLLRLEEDSAGRAQWLHTLRRTISYLQDEVRAHEIILKIARDERVLRLLDDFADGSDIANDLSSLFQDEMTESGDGSTPILISDSENRRIEIRFECGTIRFGLAWARESGFQLTRPPASARGLDQDDWIIEICGE